MVKSRKILPNSFLMIYINNGGNLFVTERPSAGGREPTEEELKFTGLNRGEIPSRSFQRLQSWTGAGKYIVVVVIIIIIVKARARQRLRAK